MDKIDNQINEISFEDSNFPFIDLTSGQENNLELLNKFNYCEYSSKKNILQFSPSKIIKFITYKKPNKTSFITTKKTKRKEINNKKYLNGRWTQEERIKFAYGLYKYGTNWKAIRQLIGTRDNIQLSSHAQKFLIKLKTSKYLMEKGLNFSKLNWIKSFRLLKKDLSDKELFSFLMSIESEIEDNKRMTFRYIEKKELMDKSKQKQIPLEQINNFVTTSDENTETILKENEPEIFKLENNNINLNENDFLEDMNFYKYELLFLNKHENYLFYKKIEKDNILLDKYLPTLNEHPFDISNHLDFL